MLILGRWLDYKGSSNHIEDNTPAMPELSPATLHHKLCNVETKHIYFLHAYSIHTHKSSAYLTPHHIPVLTLHSSTALAAKNTNVTTRETVPCYLLFVQMKVTYEHLTDMNAISSVPNASNYVFLLKSHTVIQKNSIKLVIFRQLRVKEKHFLGPGTVFLKAQNQCSTWKTRKNLL
jgi:hypothetical protein